MTTAPEIDTPWTGGPVPVTIHNPEAMPLPTPPAAPEEITCATLVLTAQDPVQQLLPIDPQRCEALILQAGDNDVVIAHSKGEAQATANSTASLPNPSGVIMLKTMLVPLVIRAQGRLLVTAQAFPTRIGVVITRRNLK